MARMQEVVKLPSNGRIYPTKEVTIQNMTVAEEKVLYSLTYNKAISEILKKCVIGMDPDDMCIGDRHYVLLRLRILTYGPDYPVELQCLQCANSFTYKVDLSTLDVDELDEKSEVEREIILPASKDKVLLRIPTQRDFDNTESFTDRKAKQTKAPRSEVSFVTSMMTSIVSINGDDEMPDDEIYSYLLNLSSRDGSYLRQQLNQTNIGFNMNTSCECPNCGKKIDFRVPMTSEFFRAGLE